MNGVKSFPKTHPLRGRQFAVAGGGVSFDYRIICDCQQHRRARSRQDLGRFLRQSSKRGGVVVILAASLGFSAVNVPSDVVQMHSAALKPRQVVAKINSAAEVPLPASLTQPISLIDLRARSIVSERVREEFFRTTVPYGSIIYREARRNGLPPELIAAVVQTESDFRPLLRSNKNALGLMQIVPETGRLMGATDLLDPADNVRTGTRYLRYLHRRFRGDLVKVLAAYNAGEGNIDRFGGVPPFRETLDYVRRVTLTRNRLARELAVKLVEEETGRPFVALEAEAKMIQSATLPRGRRMRHTRLPVEVAVPLPTTAPAVVEAEILR